MANVQILKIQAEIKPWTLFFHQTALSCPVEEGFLCISVCTEILLTFPKSLSQISVQM